MGYKQLHKQLYNYLLPITIHCKYVYCISPYSVTHKNLYMYAYCCYQVPKAYIRSHALSNGNLK